MAEMLQPGQIIRPFVTEVIARSLVMRLYGLNVTSIQELNSYDDRNFHVKVDSHHNNQYIKEICPDGYVLKILNSLDTPKTHIDAEHEAQAILHENGIACPLPVLNLEGKNQSKEEIEKQNVADGYGTHTVRLLTFVPGRILAEVPYEGSLLYKVGFNLGRVDKTWKNFSHEGFEKHQSIWNLINAPKLTEFLHAVECDERKALVNKVLAAFKSEIIPNIDKFQSGVIHGDFNEQNILVKEIQNKDLATKEYDIAGVLDFGDMSHSYYVFDVAIAIMYMMVESKIVDIQDVGGYVLSGYLSEMPLNDNEMCALKTCIAARYCQSLVMGAYSYLHDPGNEYLLVTAAKGWKQLQQLWDIPENELYARWKVVVSQNQ